MAQMQVTAKKMESEYRAILENAVHEDPLNTGSPWLPNMTDVIMEQFQVLEGELKEERDLNQNLITAANKVISDCNSAMVNRYDKKVMPKRAATTTARGLHDACRDQEDKDIPDRDVQCTEPQYLDKSVCDATQDWYNNGKLMAWPPTCGPTPAHQSACTNGRQVGFDLDSDETDLVATIAQAGKCVNYLELGIVCDANQRKFEADFCLYSQELRDTCSTHHQCYTNGVKDKAVTVANVGIGERGFAVFIALPPSITGLEFHCGLITISFRLLCRIINVQLRLAWILVCTSFNVSHCRILASKTSILELVHVAIDLLQ